MAEYSLTHLFLHSLIHSILIDLYVPGAVLDAGNITSEQIRKKKKIPVFMKFILQWG